MIGSRHNEERIWNLATGSLHRSLGAESHPRVASFAWLAVVVFKLWEVVETASSALRNAAHAFFKAERLQGVIRVPIKASLDWVSFPRVLMLPELELQASMSVVRAGCCVESWTFLSLCVSGKTSNGGQNPDRKDGQTFSVVVLPLLGRQLEGRRDGSHLPSFAC